MNFAVTAGPRRRAWIVLLAALGLPVLAQNTAQSTAQNTAQTAATARSAPTPAAGEVIVGFKPDGFTIRRHPLSTRADAAAVRTNLAERAATLGARLGRTLHAGAAVGQHVQVVRATGVDAATLARQLAADPDVAYAVPNGRKRVNSAPDDPLYGALGGRPGGPESGQWYLRAPDSVLKSAIDIEAAWASTRGGANVVVAVLDTGVRSDHPDLVGRLLPGYDFVTDVEVANDGDGRDADPSDPGDWVTTAEAATPKFANCGQADSSWHGTATASLIGASTHNGLGMAGAAPGVRVLPLRVLGKCFGKDDDILAAMRWAAGISVPGVPDNPYPAHVINLSLGSGDACQASYQSAVDEITARGVVIVAAAGNSDGAAVSEPANCRGVIGVLALRHSGTKVGFSDLGPEIAIAAPGGNCINTAAGSPCLYPILAANNSGTQGPAQSGWSDGGINATLGTSFSSPLVVGVVALMITADPTLTPTRVRAALQSSARPFPTSGANNGSDTLPVRRCDEPNRYPGTPRDLQCYCTTALCGAGMLDAGAALAAVAPRPLLTVSFTPAAPVAGQAVNFSITGLLTTNNRMVQSYAWTLLDVGGAANGFSSSSNASTATLPTLAAGTTRVQLAVTDTQGTVINNVQTVVVSAAAVAQPPMTDSGKGGGAASGAWVAGVALAGVVLRLLRRRV